MFCLLFIAVFLDEPLEYPEAYKQALKTNKPLVVFCTADYCIHCKPALARLKRCDSTGVIIGVLDVEKLPATANKIKKLYKLKTLPLPFIGAYKKNGGKWYAVSRPKSTNTKDLQKWIDQLKIKNEPDPINASERIKSCN